MVDFTYQGARVCLFLTPATTADDLESALEWACAQFPHPRIEARPERIEVFDAVTLW